LVLTTDCLWLVAPALLTHDFAEHRLAEISADNLIFGDVEISVLWRSSRSLSPAAEALITETRRLFMTYNDNSAA
jgi:hypothetical protein